MDGEQEPSEVWNGRSSFRRTPQLHTEGVQVFGSGGQGMHVLLRSPTFSERSLNDLSREVVRQSGAVAVSTTLFAPLNIMIAPPVAAVMIQSVGILWVVFALVVVAVRAGHPVGATRTLIAGGSFVILWFALFTGGIGSPVVPTMLLPIIFAAVMLGRWDGALVTVGTIVAVSAMTAAQQAGLVAPVPDWVSPALRVSFLGLSGVVLGVLVASAFETLTTAVGREREVNERLSLAGKVFDTTSEGIVITSPDGTILDVNDALLRIHRCQREDVLGKNPRVWKSDRHTPEFYQAMWDGLLKRGEWQGEVWDRRADGTLVPKWLSISTLRDAGGLPTHYVGVFSDITTIKQSEQNLQWLATHDPLTGLPNRALIDDRLGIVLARARREQGRAAVFFVDLDDFKAVNDSQGHARGDELLGAIAQRCSGVLRKSDTIGRGGGDEFTVIISDFSGTEDLEMLAGRLLEEIETPLQLGGRDVYVTASVGISVFPDDCTYSEELLQHADLAMYRAKGLGGNRFEFFSDSLQEELRNRVEIEVGIRRALQEEQLFLVYQPQVDMATGRVIGVEALVRWRMDDGSVLLPGQFMSVVEHSGLSVSLGERVLRRALADQRTLRDAGHEVTMAVNFSARQFSDVDVPTMVVGALEDAGLDPDCLEVEITESAIMSDVGAATAKVEALLDAGVQVAIDDFGTGYASMSYVQRFHPSKLKIDRGFVESVPGDLSARAIVLATIALGRGIGAKVIAEGVETDEQVRFLQESECDYAQGFRYSKPIGSQQLIALLQAPPFESAAQQGLVGAHR